MLPYILNTTIEEYRDSIKEMAYSYYMRGKNIQWCVARDSCFSPEEATEQNVHYLVTASYLTSLFRELFDTVVPYSAGLLLQYANDHWEKPEVVANTYISDNGDLMMKVYYSPDNSDLLTNPTLGQLLPLLKVGDILATSGAILICDLIMDENKNIIDAIILKSIAGSAQPYLSTKYPKSPASKGEESYPYSIDYFYGKLNSDFEEGTIQMGKLSQEKSWSVYMNTQYRAGQYAILRFIQEDSEKNIVLKYETIYSYDKTHSYDDKLQLTDSSLDRIKKFNRIYISKTVEEMNLGVVEVGGTLNYRITIRNSGDKDYKDDIIVTEILSEYVEYQEHTGNRQILSFNKDLQNNKLIWNIGKLNKGDEFILTLKL